MPGMRGGKKVFCEVRASTELLCDHSTGYSPHTSPQFQSVGIAKCTPFFPANNLEMREASPAEAGRDPTLRVFYNQKSLAISKITKKCQMHF